MRVRAYNGNRNLSRVDATVNVGNGERGGVIANAIVEMQGVGKACGIAYARDAFSESPLVLVGVLSNLRS